MINMLLLDIDAYEEKYGEKAVRKNLIIPAWLNTFAEKIISISLNFYKIPYLKWHKQNKNRGDSVRIYKEILKFILSSFSNIFTGGKTRA